MKLVIKTISYWTLLLCLALSMPTLGYAQTEMETSPFTDGSLARSAYWMGTGAVIGAAIVAATAYGKKGSEGNRGAGGETGSQGPVGLPGPAGAAGVPGPVGPEGGPFIADNGQNLIFNFNLDVVAVDPTGTVTPYVVGPDGTVYTGPTFTTEFLGPLAVPSFIIPNPLFGRYLFGLQFTSANGTLGIDISTEAVASRDGSTTTLALMGTFAGVPVGEIQIPSAFSYGPTTVP